jgi:hypothetical protein
MNIYVRIRTILMSLCFISAALADNHNLTWRVGALYFPKVEMSGTGPQDKVAIKLSYYCSNYAQNSADWYYALYVVRAPLIAKGKYHKLEIPEGELSFASKLGINSCDIGMMAELNGRDAVGGATLVGLTSSYGANFLPFLSKNPAALVNSYYANRVMRLSIVKSQDGPDVFGIDPLSFKTWLPEEVISGQLSP